MLASYLLIATTANLDDSTLSVMPKGAMAKMGGYNPQRLQLSSERPEGMLRASAIGIVEFGTLNFGPKDDKRAHYFGVSADGKLYVDSNGNGNLWDDPAPVWKPIQYKGSDGSTLYRSAGSFEIEAEIGGKTYSLSFGAYRFDPKDAGRAVLKDVILYYCDYAMVGEITLGGKTFDMMLADRAANGDFASTACQVMIDRDANGRFDSRFEIYKAGELFNIGGTTYDVNLGAVSDGVLTTSVSAESVDEKIAPPNISPGQLAIPFETKTTDGQTVKFPESYKGKIVMLDFWATWCGPCIAELPNVTRAYEEYHDQGFEILGISLDQANKLDVLNDFTKEYNMPWKQVYDGGFWDAEISRLYGIRSIPAVLLVDGDTGEILADASSLRGVTIMKTVGDALAKKKGN